MMENSDIDERNIAQGPVLYELMIYKDWKQDTEQYKPVNQQTLLAEDYLQSWWWNVFRMFNEVPWPEKDLANAAVFLLPWQISLSQNGKRVAVLQDSVLEIRASRDEYTIVIGRATIPRDKRPQFRKMAWSPDSHMVAVASSDGSVRVYDYCGSLIFKIPLIGPESNTKKLITGLEFIRSREKKSEWELLIIFANGSLDCYNISSIDRCIFSHHSILSDSGISCSAYSQEYEILFISMKPVNILSFESSTLSVGLTAWKLLNEAPYYKQIFPTLDELNILHTHGKFWRLFTLFTKKDCINKIVLSPSNENLATLHTNGTVLIWVSPILRIYSKLDKLDTNQQKVMVMLSETKKSFHAIDIEWRKDNKLIVGWKNGTISIHDINSSDVLSYFGPEILNGIPRLTSAPSLHGFLVLECETVHSVRPSVSPDNNADEEKSLFDTVSDLIKSTMYTLTDLEKYEPKMKSVKIVQRIFRLLGVKMTTPEELFERYLQSNEFDKAFEICEEYRLDIMKVYQRQWRISEVCDYTIQEYLNNVQDEEWILDECLNRIPETISSAKLLIEYSLNFTNRKSYFNELKKSNEFMFKKFIHARHRFLDYEAKFRVYELIIDENSYNMTLYERFRGQSIVDSAIDFARSGHSVAIELLLTYHGDEILPYWMNILDNFAESINPWDYRSLLPKCNDDGVPVKWKSIMHSETLDWSLEECFSEFHNVDITPRKKFDEIYSFDSEGLSNWYKKRAVTLEKRSTIVDNAVILLQLGIDRNIKGIEETMLFEFKMLSTLVYELGLNINFGYLEKLSILQKLQLFIKKPDDFDASMIRYIHPALEHYADLQTDEWLQLYHNFLLNNSKKSLGPVLKYIKNILYGKLHLIGPFERIINVFMDCIYIYEPLDQLCESEASITDAENWLSAVPDKLCSTKKSIFKSLLVLKNEIRSDIILSHHHYGKPLSFLHNLKEDLEKSKQFIEEFANNVFKSLALDVDIWMAFLTDLLDLQRNCFLNVPTEFCYEIFVSHMLKSSFMALIEYSPIILCCSKNERQRHLSFERSVDIVISSSQYYFNSSSHFDDKFMQLAKTCLLLIQEDNEHIQEEFDLIFAMNLLSQLGVNILPIQVRQTKERIKLIDICFDRNHLAYKNPQLIRRLALKLHLQHENKLKCYNIINLCLAQEAFRRCDYGASAEFCNDLISNQYPESWKICMNLGECSKYKDIKTKLRLITFSSIFAPGRLLPHLFKIREELNYKKMISSMCSSLDDCVQCDIIQNTDYFKWNSLKESPVKSKENLQTITELWSNLMIEKFSLEMVPSDFLLVFPNIYSSLHPCTYKIYNNNFVRTHNSSKESMMFDVAQLILKLIYLNSDLEDYQTKEILLKALTTCGVLSAQQDSALSLCFFLTLFSDNLSMKTHFKESHLIFAMELYLIALKDLCLHSADMFSSTPIEVISSFIEHPFKEAHLKSFKMLITTVKNYNQTTQVKSLGYGIDTARFNQDEDYKKDTIFGLAMNEEYDNLKLAMDLAKQNNLSVQDVLASHLTYLLINSSTSALTERISNHEIISILHECKEHYIGRLIETLPLLNGTNYQIFILFFSLIKILKDDYCVWSLTGKEHISLLKKLKSLTKDIDYKDLLMCNDELHFVLQPVMKSDNILVVSKFIKSLPAVIKNKYEIGKFFCQWAIEEFNKKCINVSFKQSVINFESLGKFFTKLSEDELQMFFESTVLSLSSVSVMEIGLRKQLIVTLMDWCNSNNVRNQNEGFLYYLQKNLDILNQLWDEDYELWNHHLKKYVFSLEQTLRESNNEKDILEVFENALLDSSVTKADLIYLHKITHIKEPILFMITKLISTSNAQIMDKWKKLFSEKEEEISNICSDYDKILTKHKYSSCDPDDYWVEKIFSTFQEEFPLEVLKKKMNNTESSLLFLPELIKKTSNFEQIAAVHQYLQELAHEMEFDKVNFEIALLKSLRNVESNHKFALGKDILSSSSIRSEDIVGLFDSDITPTDKLFLCWLYFHSDSTEVQTVGRNLIEEEGDQLDEQFFLLPSIVIGKIIPFMMNTKFYQRFINKCLQHNFENELLENCVSALLDKHMVVEATSLALTLNHTPKGLKSFETMLKYSSII